MAGIQPQISGCRWQDGLLSHGSLQERSEILQIVHMTLKLSSVTVNLGHTSRTGLETGLTH